MNVRAQLLGQKWQRVDSSLTAWNFRLIAASMPMNVEWPLRMTTRRVSIAAPIAPASPVCGWT